MYVYYKNNLWIGLLIFALYDCYKNQDDSLEDIRLPCSWSRTRTPKVLTLILFQCD